MSLYGSLYYSLASSNNVIRKLTLLPTDNAADPLHLTMETVSLLDKPSYEALSYVWGSNSKLNYAWVNDHAISITEGLNEALLALRSSSRSRELWIDAICVNQSDQAERTNQVRLMRDIYAAARCVLLWLGRSNRHTDQTMALLRKQQLKRMKKVGLLKDEEMRELMRPGLEDLMSRSWWRRMWTFQEFVVANKALQVGCGSEWISWDRFSAAVYGDEIWGERMWFQVRDQEEYSFLKLRHARQNLLERGVTRSLEELIDATIMREASDPRDKVFALAGIVDAAAAQDIQPNYQLNKSLVFQKATLGLIRERNKLDIIGKYTGKVCTSLPTWCIDFCHGEINFRVPRRGSVNASRGVPLDYLDFRPAQGELIVRGCIVGKVANVISALPVLRDAKSNRQNFQDDWIESMRRIENFTLVAQNALQSRLGAEKTASWLVGGNLWSVIAMGDTFRGIAGHELPDGLDVSKLPNDLSMVQYLALRNFSSCDIEEVFPWFKDAQPWPTELEHVASLVMFRIVQKLCAEDQTFFSTDTGFAGICNKPVKQDDILTIVFGCCWPVILRQNGFWYEIIGWTYTSGVMYGEFITREYLASNRVRTKVLHLR